MSLMSGHIKGVCGGDSFIQFICPANDHDKRYRDNHGLCLWNVECGRCVLPDRKNGLGVFFIKITTGLCPWNPVD